MSDDKTLSIFAGPISSTPLGPLYIAVTQHGLIGVEFCETPDRIIHSLAQRLKRRCRALNIQSQDALQGNISMQPPGSPQAYIYVEAAHQISDYLHSKRRDFDLPIDWCGMTPFQEQALRQTLTIPYGKNSTYAQIAQQMGRPKAARAVGRAEATNPMPLVIPCHRVLGSDGRLHGYGGRGGLQTKTWLLELEKNTQ